MDDEEIKRALWRRLEFAGVSAFVVTMSCVFIGQTAEYYASQFTNPNPQQQTAAAASPKFNAIDYATTGATKGATTVIIGPCDDKSR